MSGFSSIREVFPPSAVREPIVLQETIQLQNLTILENRWSAVEKFLKEARNQIFVR